MQIPELHFKPKLRVINDDQIRHIHMATLEVLERTGVKMTHPRGLELLDGAGARVPCGFCSLRARRAAGSDRCLAGPEPGGTGSAGRPERFGKDLSLAGERRPRAASG